MILPLWVASFPIAMGNDQIGLVCRQTLDADTERYSADVTNVLKIEIAPLAGHSKIYECKVSEFTPKFGKKIRALTKAYCDLNAQDPTKIVVKSSNGDELNLKVNLQSIVRENQYRSSAIFRKAPYSFDCSKGKVIRHKKRISRR